MVSLLPAERAAELAEGPVTIDIDATDVEVYGSKKRGVAYNYQGQRAGRPHVASWAETEIPLAADLLAGDQDPRSHVTGLLGRALAALPQAVRDGAAAAGRKIALRADAGYFAGELARAAAKENMAFAIGAKRIPSMWKALAADRRRCLAGRDRHGQRAGRRVAVPARRLARQHGAADPPGQAGPRSGLRRSPVAPPPHPAPRSAGHAVPRAGAAAGHLRLQLHLHQPRLLHPGQGGRRRALVPAPHQRREHLRDSKHGAALRHLPSGHEQVNTAWMWASLIAAAIAAWLHQLTGLIQGGELVEGHGTRGGKAMIATLRRVLIAVPARLVRHGGQLLMRLAPGEHLLPGILAAIRALPAPAR